MAITSFGIKSLVKHILVCVVLFDNILLEAKSSCEPTKDALAFQATVLRCSMSINPLSPKVVHLCINNIAASLQKVSENCRVLHSESIQTLSVSQLETYAGQIADNHVAGQDVDSQKIKNFVSLFQLWFSKIGKTLYVDFDVGTKDSEFQKAYKSIESSFLESMNKIALTQIVDDDNSVLFKRSSLLIGDILDQVTEENAEVPFGLLVPFLETLEDRVDMLEKFHKISCQFESCKLNDSVVLQIMQLFANMHSQEELEAAISQATLVPKFLVGIFSKIHNVFPQLLKPFIDGNSTARRPGFSKNFTSANTSGERENALQNLSLYDFPEDQARFVRLIQKSRSYLSSYSVSGSSLSGDENRIDFNPSFANAEKIMSHSRGITGKLRDRINEYRNQRSHVLGLLKENVARDGEQIDFERSSLSLQMAEAINDLNALTAGLSEKELRFAEYMTHVHKVKSGVHFNSYDSCLIDSGESRKIEMRASDAIYTDTLSVPIALDAISYPRHVISSSPELRQDESEVINFEVTGNWSPICSLSRSTLSEIAGKSPEIGPEGYFLSFSKNDVQVSGHSSSRREIKYSESGQSVDHCLTLNTGVSAGPFGSTSGSAAECANQAQGRRKETSKESFKSSQFELRQSAAFQGGLRLPHTPFPHYPVGSLIAIVAPAEATRITEASEIRVVGRTSSIFLRGGQKIYFVANDCSGGGSQGTLIVHIQKLKSKSAEANSLLKGMAASLAVLQAKSEKLDQELHHSPSVLKVLRSEIVSTLTQGQLGDLRNYPVLAELYNYWLDNEMLQVERRAAIRELKRKITQLDIRMASLNLQAKSAKEKAKIQKLLLQLAIHNSDVGFLSSTIHDALAFSTRTLGPILRLHYPSLTGIIQKKTTALRKLGFLDNLSTYGDALVEVLESVDSQILEQNSFHNTAGTQYQNLLVRIPKPGETPSSFSPIADEATRELVWDILDPLSNKKELKFEIRPEDLYKNSKMKGRLTCKHYSPVIESMMLIFVLEDAKDLSDIFIDTLNSGPATLPVHLGPNMDFLTEKGSIHFRLTNPDIGSSIIPLGFVRSTTVDLSYQFIDKLTTAQNSGFGFSPFTTFTFGELETLRSYLSEENLEGHRISEMLILIRAKIEVGSANWNFVRTCQEGI